MEVKREAVDGEREAGGTGLSRAGRTVAGGYGVGCVGEGEPRGIWEGELEERKDEDGGLVLGRQDGGYGGSVNAHPPLVSGFLLAPCGSYGS